MVQKSNCAGIVSNWIPILKHYILPFAYFQNGGHYIETFDCSSETKWWSKFLQKKLHNKFVVETYVSYS